jgi:hypothetical protein
MATTTGTRIWQLLSLAVLLLGSEPAAPVVAGTPPPGSATRASQVHHQLAQDAGLRPCATADLDCRAFTGTLSWRPDERRPLLSTRGLKRLVLLHDIAMGERERGLRCLAFVAWAEARSDGVAGMRAVIAVVINRSRDPAFPRHPCEVIAASAAFEPMRRRSYRQAALALRSLALLPFPRPDNAVDASALQLARLLAWNMAGSSDHHDPTAGATHFLAPAVLRERDQPLPTWATVYKRTATIGGHEFFRRPLRLAQDG